MYIYIYIYIYTYIYIANGALVVRVQSSRPIH